MGLCERCCEKPAIEKCQKCLENLCEDCFSKIFDTDSICWYCDDRKLIIADGPQGMRRGEQ